MAGAGKVSPEAARFPVDGIPPSHSAQSAIRANDPATFRPVSRMTDPSAKKPVLAPWRAPVSSAIALLLAGCGAVEGDVLGDTDTLMRAIYLLALLALVLFGVRGAGSFGKTVKYLVIWLALLLALIYAYSFRDDARGVYSRIMGELLPSVAQEAGEGVVTLRRDIDGHFAARVFVNGRPETFLLDTGASSVVLPWRVAEELGFDPANRSFIVSVSTANGMASAAPLRIERMEIGGIVVEDVAALVTERGRLSQPLLGMSFLDRLSGFEVSGNTLTLRR